MFTSYLDISKANKTDTKNLLLHEHDKFCGSVIWIWAQCYPDWYVEVIYQGTMLFLMPDSKGK